MNINEHNRLDFLYGLHRIQTIQSLSEFVCLELPSLIGGENAIVCTHDGRQKIITSFIAKHPLIRANLMPFINESGVIDQHLFWEDVLRDGLSVRVLSDLVDKKRWHRNPLYKQVFGREGIEDQINMKLLGDPGRFMTVNALRGKRGFQTKERELFETLGRHISRAFFNAHISEQAGVLKHLPDAAFVLQMDPCGSPIPNSASAPASALALFDANGRLPDDVLAWCRRQILRMNQGIFESQIRPICFKQGHAAWSLTLHRQGFAGAYALCVSRKDSLRTPNRLSPKETVVIQLIAKGKTNQEIAEVLALRESSVKTHLKRIFQKLGVSNRTSAVNVWQNKIFVPEI